MPKRSIWVAGAFLGAVLSVAVPMAMSQSQKEPGGKTMATVVVHHLDQQAVEKHEWGEIHWMMSGKIDSGSAQTFGVVQINAGQKNALHSHPNCEEILYVLSGSCEHLIGDRKVILHAGDLIRVPAGVKHQATVLGKEPLRAVISYSSGNRQVTNYGSAIE